ncbi:MAG TPA: S8 family serine peptidase [Candidatus Binatia bacterium]
MRASADPRTSCTTSRARRRLDVARAPLSAGALLVALALLVTGALLPTAVQAGDVGRLMAIARERGTARVLVRLDVPEAAAAAPDASEASRVASRRTAIRASRAKLARDLGSTAWAVAREFDTIPYVALEVTPAALTALTLSGAVVDVEEDRLEKVMLPESVPLIGGDAAWSAGFDGDGWVVAILDTGALRTHPFLAGKIVDEACFSRTGDCPNGQTEQFGPGAGAPCAYAEIACQHGTHVAGIAAGRNAEFAGVARGAGIISIQVFSRFEGRDCDDDIEDPCAKSYTSDTIAALEWLYEMRNTYKIAAANLSLGGGSFSSQATCDMQDGARKAAIDLLRSVGIVTVAASGNEASTSALSAPGCISSAVSVGAVNKGDQIAGFSNSASFLTLLAPGTSIWSSVPPDGFEFVSGTSESTPHVAGAFAILNQRLGRGDVDLVLSILQQTGVPIRDPRNGVVKPRIDILAALEALPIGNPSGLQITPDQARTLISKDVGNERWAISYNPEDQTITGNVFDASGGPPKFVWCERTGDDGNPDPYDVQIDFACSGADACTGSSCPVDDWTFIGEVPLPGSFLLPPRGQVASTGGAAPGPGGTSGGSGRPSGLQITPDRRRTLISKDVGSERWAITLNPDQTVTGNVFQANGAEPSFVWCERTGDDGNPDPARVIISFSCFGADRCQQQSCSPDEWTFIGDVELPGSFFLPG